VGDDQRARPRASRPAPPRRPPAAAAIDACGNCGQPSDAHQFPAGTSREDIEILHALGGPCGSYALSRAAMALQRHLGRAEARRSGPPCQRCAMRGHTAATCPI
jgi:hypothetical protein